MKAKKIVLKCECWDHHTGHKCVFRGEAIGVDISKLPVLHLSRDGKKCEFRLDEVHLHDSHTPLFTKKADMDVYMQRVFTEAKTKLLESGLVTEDEIQALPW